MPDGEGLDYWTKQLTTETLTVGNIAVNIGLAARDADRDTLAAKSKAAQIFTSKLDTAVEVASYAGDWAIDLGRTFLKPIGTTYMPTEQEIERIVRKLTSSDVSPVGIDPAFQDPLG